MEGLDPGSWKDPRIEVVSVLYTTTRTTRRAGLSNWESRLSFQICAQNLPSGDTASSR